MVVRRRSRVTYRNLIQSPEKRSTNLAALLVIVLVILTISFIFLRVIFDSSAALQSRSDTLVKGIRDVKSSVASLKEDVRLAVPPNDQFTYNPGCIMVDTTGNPVDDQTPSENEWYDNWYRCVGTCTNPPSGQGDDTNSLCKPVKSGLIGDKVKCECSDCDGIDDPLQRLPPGVVPGIPAQPV